VAYHKSLTDAVAAPRFHHQSLPEELSFENGRAPRETIDALNAKGHAVSGRAAIGDVHAVLFDGGRLVAVADPRHGGAAGGW
jgi:gamma-glutamyltranspeptidase/glutathione hydrolase